MCWLMKHTADFCVCMRMAVLGVLENLPVGMKKSNVIFLKGNEGSMVYVLECLSLRKSG